MVLPLSGDRPETTAPKVTETKITAKDAQRSDSCLWSRTLLEPPFPCEAPEGAT